MIVKCSNCETSYSVEDSKIKGKIFAFDCPNCSHHNVIDNREETEIENPQDEMSPVDESTIPETSDDFSDFDETPSETEESFVDETFDDNLMSGDDLPLEDDGEMEESAELEEDSPDFEDDLLSEDFDIDNEVEEDDDDDNDFSDDLLNIDDEDSGVEAEVEPVSEDEEFDIMSGTDSDDFDLPGGLDEDLEEIDEDDFEDEIEPEINMDLINSPESAELSIEDELSDSEPVQLDGDDDIDIDSLDLDLPDDDFEPVQDEAGADISDEIQSDTVEADEENVSDDESITIDLDSLDIDLEDSDSEIEDDSFEMDDDIPEDIDIEAIAEEAEVLAGNEFAGENSPEEDSEVDDLTLDLDSLDINLEESDEILEGEKPEELAVTGIEEAVEDDEDESRLSLEDAGLSLDEFDSSENVEVYSEMLSDEDEDDELRLSIDEINPELDMDDLASDSGTVAQDFESDPVLESEDDFPELDSDHFVDDDELLAEDFEEGNLPEVDFDSFEEDSIAEEEPAAAVSVSDDFLDIEESEYVEEVVDDVDHNGRGFLNFSIDYSLKFSRLKAFLKLIGVFHILLIPHFIVFAVYSVLSSVLGFLNWILILFSGCGEKDFFKIQEKNLRYYMSINAVVADVIEDLPPFKGEESLNYPLQMKVFYPEKRSKFLAFMRITGVGIYLLTIPHILILTLLSLGVMLLIVISLIAVIITGRWPNVLFDFMVRYYRYVANVGAYVSGLVDSYPSFRFD